MKNKLLVRSNSNKPIIVIGAPHQAPPHIGTICTPKRTSDIDSGILAKEIYDNLEIPAKLVIMDEATGIDPNKDINTPYSKEILNSGAKLLLEIHGQSNRNKHPLEFSAGKNDLSQVSKFGLLFYEELIKLDIFFPFAVQEKKDFKEAIVITKNRELKCDELVLPALKSTLIDEVENYNMGAIHLETMPRFRYESNEDRRNLSIALSGAIRRLLCHTE